MLARHGACAKADKRRTLRVPTYGVLCRSAVEDPDKNPQLQVGGCRPRRMWANRQDMNEARGWRGKRRTLRVPTYGVLCRSAVEDPDKSPQLQVGGRRPRRMWANRKDMNEARGRRGKRRTLRVPTYGVLCRSAVADLDGCGQTGKT
jgi:hypothetical protein